MEERKESPHRSGRTGHSLPVRTHCKNKRSLLLQTPGDASRVCRFYVDLYPACFIVRCFHGIGSGDPQDNVSGTWVGTLHFRGSKLCKREVGCWLGIWPSRALDAGLIVSGPLTLGHFTTDRRTHHLFFYRTKSFHDTFVCKTARDSAPLQRQTHFS